MTETTAALIVASAVETTWNQVVPHQQYVLDHKHILILAAYNKHIAGLVKHLSPYTGRISD